MRNSLETMRGLILVVTLLFLANQICATNHVCPPSSCGKITNITYPFRLKGDPKDCGDKRYELVCENNLTVLSLYSGKYHVQGINYNNFTIRVADPGVQEPNCSSLPLYFLSGYNFSTGLEATDPYQASQNTYLLWVKLIFQHVVFLECSHAVSENSKYVDTSACVSWNSKGYTYAIAGDLEAKDFEVGCHVKLVATTSWWGFNTNNVSYSMMHTALNYGFEISWERVICENLCHKDRCFFNSSTQKLKCYPGYTYGILWWHLEVVVIYGGISIFMLWVANKFIFGVPFFIVLLVYKWRKRHLSIYGNIENYLEQNNLMPIGYSYKEIKKMTSGFKDKIGGGGYGSVFKGKLRSGACVAIKMLSKSKGNGCDFISEVATMGRIHHQNVVQLIGFCAEGSKRALVYEFMSNGSLDKFIFSKEGNINLSYDKIYNISIEIARGIAYLHHGCEMQILHFDIKPHNILLDEKFIPKISDFGLAKLYSINNHTITMTAARGTIGYMAPELFYKNIGRISHKADVYSFGMLLMEMSSQRRNLDVHAVHSSQLYFPFWIYDQLGKEKDIEIKDVTDDEKEIAMKMIIVALWCIQLKPSDRPSMNKVVEMLEGDIQNLEIPPKPSLYPHETMVEDSRITLAGQTISSVNCSDYSMEIATDWKYCFIIHNSGLFASMS